MGDFMGNNPVDDQAIAVFIAFSESILQLFQRNFRAYHDQRRVLRTADTAGKTAEHDGQRIIGISAKEPVK